MSEAARALFLDRDGVINHDAGYTHAWERFRFVDGIFALGRAARARGYLLVVVTNQAGIARGRFSWPEYTAVAERIAELLAQEGARLDRVYACPFHEAGREPYRHPDHPDRKPNPGMLLRAAAELDLDPVRSWMVGDKASDLQAGRRAGCKVALVRTGYGREVDPAGADLVAEDLPEAIAGILRQWP